MLVNVESRAVPTYQYRCTSCHNELEAVQKFTDDPLTVCPQCHGELRKVFGAVGIVFKGSGFYKTDSRGGSAASVPASSKRSETKPETTTAPSPAPAAAAASTSTSSGSSSAA